MKAEGAAPVWSVLVKAGSSSGMERPGESRGSSSGMERPGESREQLRYGASW
ncbi:hypothetical protein [Paenibacillus polymyxa]|uniref:hypothetical protein n=1 Tax=Paenibacillus polymyxa TaxID=1406 RepID=UPI002ED103D9|nr:hypothetical protein [Paenibacillus polymyxa]